MQKALHMQRLSSDIRKGGKPQILMSDSTRQRAFSKELALASASAKWISAIIRPHKKHLALDQA